MGSKGRAARHLFGRPSHGSMLVHPDPYGPSIHHPPPRDFAPFDMLPPSEIMENKLASQHLEMQKLITENHRLASTHGTSRRELAAAQHELQLLHTQIEAIEFDREQQTRALKDKIARMEAEIRAGEPMSTELQQARGEAQALLDARQELISKAQQLAQDLQRAQSDVQNIPPMLTEMESLRQDYQHCRATYEQERKLYNDHVESLQLMEKNYMNMASEMEKLRAELANAANLEGRMAGRYGHSTGYSQSANTNNYSIGENVYGDVCGGAQGRAPVPTGTNVGGIAGGTSPQIGAQSVPASDEPSYDAPKRTGYDAQGGSVTGHGYNAQTGPSGPGYNPQAGSGVGDYEAHRGHGYDDGCRGSVHDAQRGSGYDVQRVAHYNVTKVSNYDASSKGTVPFQGRAAPSSNTPGHVGPGYDAAAARGGNPPGR